MSGLVKHQKAPQVRHAGCPGVGYVTLYSRDSFAEIWHYPNYKKDIDEYYVLLSFYTGTEWKRLVYTRDEEL